MSIIWWVVYEMCIALFLSKFFDFYCCGKKMRKGVSLFIVMPAGMGLFYF